MQDIPNQAPQQVIIQQIAPSNLIKKLDVDIPAKDNATPTADELALADQVKKKLDAYEKLPCSEEDKACVHQIITILAQNGKLSLLFKQNELKQLGSKINHLHPLKFLSAIFTNPDLKARTTQFFRDSFKRTAFMNEVGAGLSTEAEKGGLTPTNIEKFAQEVNTTAERIRPFFDTQDWEGLVEFLTMSDE